MLLSADVIAVHLSNLEGDAAENEAAQMRRQWAEQVEAPAPGGLVPPKLELVRTPYREFITPLLEQIDKIKRECPTGRRGHHSGDRGEALVVGAAAQPPRFSTPNPPRESAGTSGWSLLTCRGSCRSEERGKRKGSWFFVLGSWFLVLVR